MFFRWELILQTSTIWLPVFGEEIERLRWISSCYARFSQENLLLISMLVRSKCEFMWTINRKNIKFGGKKLDVFSKVFTGVRHICQDIEDRTRWQNSFKGKVVLFLLKFFLFAFPWRTLVWYLVISPPGSFATNQLATKQSLLATNNLITINHKPKRLIRCLCYVEWRVAITNQATSYNSLVLSHKRTMRCPFHAFMLNFSIIIILYL